MKKRILAALAGIAALAGAPSVARAGDADASAVAVASGNVYVGGSTFATGDLRSSVIGRFNPAAGAFDWLERVEGAAGAADGITDVVSAGGYVYGIGYGNGGLVVSKIDPSTGTLQRSCGAGGVTVNGLAASILPGRAAALGNDLVVVGGTLALPTRGVIAIVDGSDCTVRTSAMIGAADPQSSVGFTTVTIDATGHPVAAGFSGSDAALFRFAPDLTPMQTRTFDLGGLLGEAFTGLAAGPDGGVAVALAGTTLTGQCFTLPALSAAPACGAGGRRTLSFGSGTGAPVGSVALARMASGGWLVAGSQLGWAAPAGFLARAALAAVAPTALAADTTVFAPLGAQVLNPFPYLPSGFAAVTANADGITGTGTAGYPGSRRPFLFTSRPDGSQAAVTPLDGFESAPAAPVEPAPPADPPPADQPVAAPPPAVPPRPALATARWGRLAKRPDASGGFGAVSLRCARACTAAGTYTAKVRGHTVRVGTASSRLAAGDAVRLRLALSPSGRKRLGHSRRLAVTVRFRVTGARQERALFQTAVRLTARASRQR
ncbi:hypothetical protein OM076_35535 [Solirubrobacter ginsenosidimutans]|uniref:Uncharacterized protein n=1 Tax=Solirubrobacter ginsenosidimutans TaxID=490573 RepID=A0A9X3MZI5_9ACTN|nr:hypothetical protein [Solirubrobacter ginsenosidimutans]MDA0165634.1 hypothetical protein [Solirubrobacter ginsenosidimutans]